jgi:hypothetical protein
MEVGRKDDCRTYNLCNCRELKKVKAVIVVVGVEDQNSGDAS